MFVATSFLHKASLQHCRACLGICRHCLASTSSAQPCHAALPDTIVALEIAIALLETGSELAYERLCHCAEVCAESVTKWGHSPHPRCQQSAGACRTFVTFWHSETGGKGFKH